MMTVIEKQYMDAVIAINRRMRDKEIDWEQRRYEVAKDIFVSIEHTFLSGTQKQAEYAVKAADTLIAELQKKKE